MLAIFSHNPQCSLGRILNKILLICSIFLVVSCGGKSDKHVLKEPRKYTEPLIKANKEVVRTESEQIEDYIGRHHWTMNETSSGLKYWIYLKGLGPQVKPGDVVKLNYITSLLSGDTAYTSTKEGPLIFKQGNGQVISGLEEAVLLLHVGDKAKIIIPSHLAYGLVGDQKRIPQKSTLVYDIELTDISEK